MQYIAINPKTIINISPRKYGWINLSTPETLEALPRTTLFINHADEIARLAKMITNFDHQDINTITTTDNLAFIKAFYQVVEDNLNLADAPVELNIEDISSLELNVIELPNNQAIKAIRIQCHYEDLEGMLKGQMVNAGLKFPNNRPLSKEELEMPLVMDEDILEHYPLPTINGKVYYLSPIALRYIAYIYASIIYQFVYGK